jgi:hypothetical protein
MVEPVFGRWGPTEVMERVLDGTWAEVVDGMGLIEPASVSFSGTSAAITGLGSVEFSAVSSLSLNGVFSSDFDNYMLVMRFLSTDGIWLNARFRSSAVDNSTASSYVTQNLIANGTSIGTDVGRLTDNAGRFFGANFTLRNGFATYIYGPSLTQPTAWRSTGVNDALSARTFDFAGTHNQSVSYDGLTLICTSQTISGRVAVYGMVK